jgi:acetoin utilization protein AcuB
MKNLPISRLMNKPLVIVAPGDALSQARALMEQRDVHHLLVMDQGRMAGILSSADLLKLALLRRPGPGLGDLPAEEALGIRVRDLMQTHVAVVRENSSLREVTSALSLGGFHALPVLAIDGTPVGIVTSSDLIGLLIDQLECDASGGQEGQPRPARPPAEAMPLLLEVLQVADVYLHSGQSAQQHARLSLAVSRAREHIRS